MEAVCEAKPLTNEAEAGGSDFLSSDPGSTPWWLYNLGDNNSPHSVVERIKRNHAQAALGTMMVKGSEKA